MTCAWGRSITAETIPATSVIDCGSQDGVGCWRMGRTFKTAPSVVSDAECTRQYFGDAAISLVAGSKK